MKTLLITTCVIAALGIAVLVLCLLKIGKGADPE